jgi:putative zinc finger protein
MACERYREALTDFAAGGLLPAELEAHLETCAACREELALSRRALETVDADLRQLAAVEPSRDLAARIRLAAAELAAAEEVANAWHPAFALRALAVGVLVAVLAFVLFRGRAPSPASVATVSPRPPQTEAMPRSSPPAPEAPAASRSTVSARPMEGVRRPLPPARPALPPEPEVLVPPGQLEALERLAALVNRQRVASPSLAAVEQGSPELVPPRPIEVRSVEITPLAIVPSESADDSET